MKPILYGERSFDIKNGERVGVLSDALKCIVTEARNGRFELELRYPAAGKLFSRISVAMVIFAIAEDGGEPQPFRIYYISRPMNGVVTVRAQHISYDLSGVPCGPFKALNPADAFAHMESAIVGTNKFTFYSDMTTGELMYTSYGYNTVKKILCDPDNSLTSLYGGELKYDGLSVKLLSRRGRDTDYKIQYGVNLLGLRYEEDISRLYSDILPFYNYQDPDTPPFVLPELTMTVQKNPLVKKILPVDLTYDFAKEPSAQAFRIAGSKYIKDNLIGKPLVNVKLDFLQLSKTDQYKNYIKLQEVHLCDTIHVYHPDLDIDIKAKVIKLTYDSLLERIESLEIGEPLPMLQGARR